MKKSMLFALLAATLLLVFTGCTSGSPINNEPEETPFIQIISPEDAKDLIGTKGVTLLDVRTLEEYDAGHIDGAILLPYDAITADSDGLPDDKNDVIIVYCRSGNRSNTAASTLSDIGYTRIYDLGGIRSWPYEIVK